MSEEPLLLRPDEVAKELALSTSKIYQMLAANELPAIRIGAAVRVPREDLRLWIERRMREQRGKVGLEVLSG
jgi:excisionase family DNA binding protein